MLALIEARTEALLLLLCRPCEWPLCVRAVVMDCSLSAQYLRRRHEGEGGEAEGRLRAKESECKHTLEYLHKGEADRAYLRELVTLKYIQPPCLEPRQEITSHGTTTKGVGLWTHL